MVDDCILIAATLTLLDSMNYDNFKFIVSLG